MSAKAQRRMVQRRKDAGLCTKCGGDRDNSTQLCGACKEKDRTRTAAYRKRVKAAVIEMYGGVCSCCGEEEHEFLTIDHINGGGGVERVEQGGATNRYNRYLDEKRDDLRVMCFNCNFSAHQNGGRCIHEMHP